MRVALLCLLVAGCGNSNIMRVGTGSPGGQGLVLDATTVYWASSSVCDDCATTAAEILTAPLSGGEATELFSSSEAFFNFLAVDDSFVYVTQSPESVLRIPKAGGVSQLVASAEDLGAVAVDDNTVYFVSDTSIMTAPKDGSGTPTTLVSDAGSTSPIAVDDTTVYYSQAGTMNLMSVPKTGGTSTVLVPSAQATTIESPQFAIDDTNAYFIGCGEECATDVFFVPKAGGTAQQLASSGNTATNLAVGSSSVFISTEAGTIEQAPKTGGTTFAHLASDSNEPGAIAVDGDDSHVYWLEIETGDVYRASTQ